MWLTVLCFTALMMEKQPSADGLTLFYGLLPNCSMWAINLSPAIPKQSSNQWEIMSAIDGPAFLFLPLVASPDVLSVSFLSLSSSHSSSLILPAWLTPPPACLAFPPALPAPEMQHLSSSEL